MDKNDLLDQLTQDIIAYVMKGAFPEREFAARIKPDELDDRFEDYELLLDLHFVLSEDIRNFIQRLPNEVRSIRTETQNVSRTVRGAVDGRINWSSTVAQRASKYPQDSSIFVVENRSENYNIPENLVLKYLLSIIHRTLREAEPFLRGEYAWVQETWKGDEELLNKLIELVERNVHVRRIRDPREYEPTERMLTQAEESRKDLYRCAATLVRKRKRLFEGDQKLLKELLDETTITPDDEETLFELFVLFRFIATIDNMRAGRFTLKTIQRDRQEVAYFEGEQDIVLYHDNSARDRDLSFVTGIDEGRENLSRPDRVHIRSNEIVNAYFTDHDFENHTGRPDVIVLEIISEDDEYDYLITEVKNSTRKKTIQQGIKETMEYLAFLQLKDEFVFNEGKNKGIFGSGWNGLLVIQDIEEETAPFAEQDDREIKILQASELNEDLEVILNRIL